MSDMPERIWVIDGGPTLRLWSDEMIYGTDVEVVEYIRADLHAAIAQHESKQEESATRKEASDE